MKIIFLSIEFSIGTFSGNGIYAISQVRALRQLGHEVLVICGRPAAVSTATATTTTVNDVLSIPLPIWSRLDLQCSWKEYALGCGTPSIVNAVVNFEADIVLGVDWHSFLAYQNLIEAFQATKISTISFHPSSKIIQIPPYACSNYRVYLRSLPHDSDNNTKEVELIRKLENDSLLQGICSIVLSASDKNFVEENYYYNLSRPALLKPPPLQTEPPPPPLYVILPALRADLAAIPLPDQQQQQQQRKYLLCCVRASPEKEPHRFINLICELQQRDFFNKHGIIPLLVGSGWKVPSRAVAEGGGDGVVQNNDKNNSSLSRLEKYVLDLRQQVESEVPCCQVIETFLGPTEMAEIYSQTVLNIHPPAYDAYGMTICEAASQMVPSLVAHLGHVGATDLLRPEREEIFVTDMEDNIENLADVVENLLENRENLKKVGENAAAVAWAWNEKANAAALIRVLEESLGEYLKKESSSNDKEGIDVLSSEERSPFKKITRRGDIDVLLPLSLSTPTSTDNSDNDLNDDKMDLRNAYKFFEDSYLAANKPVIFSGIAKNWLASKEFVISSDGGGGGDDPDKDTKINIENLNLQFGASRVVATDTARRHRGQGPCKEMSVAEYCQWWKEHYQRRNGKIKKENQTGQEEKEDKEEDKEELWYLKDWHFIKDLKETATAEAAAISTVSLEIEDQHSDNKHSSTDFYYYQLPLYFSDDWLNEWYDSLSRRTITTSSTDTTEQRSPQPQQQPSSSSLATSSDYRFLYLGPQGSSTPLHTDVLHSHSWSANIAGRKLWRLLPAEYAHLVQDKSTGMSHPYDFDPEEEEESQEKLEKKVDGQGKLHKSVANNKSIKINDINSLKRRFPGLHEAQQYIIEIIQYPGEAIFVPSGWYHTVQNIDDCLSINHNWISSHSVMNSWRYLQKERARAENLIEDCRELNGVAEFESLVQRNVEANAGLGYAAFGAMVRYIAMKAVKVEKKGENELEIIENLNFFRVSAAEKVLSELVQEQEKILFLAGDKSGKSGINDSEDEQVAREALLIEMKLNKECIEMITATLS